MQANVSSAAAAASSQAVGARPKRAAKPKAKAVSKATSNAAASAVAKTAPAAKAAAAASAAAETAATEPYLGPGAKPPTPEQERCPHPRDATKAGKNQYAFWTKCDRCQVRLSYQPVQRDEHFTGMSEVFVCGEDDELDDGVFTVDKKWHDTTKNRTNDLSGKGIWDSGCRRTVAGSWWLENFRQQAEARGHKMEYETDDAVFRFGNQGLLKSGRRWRLPVSLY